MPSGHWHRWCGSCWADFRVRKWPANRTFDSQAILRVRPEGLEPSRDFSHSILSAARRPIPPRPRAISHRTGPAAEGGDCGLSAPAPFRSGRPPRHQVAVIAWQLGQRSRRFSARSSLQSPLMWSTSRVMGLSCQTGGVAHSAHRSGMPICRRARRNCTLLVRRAPPCLTRICSGGLAGVVPGLPRLCACPRKRSVLMPLSVSHSRSWERVRALSGWPSLRSVPAMDVDSATALRNALWGGGGQARRGLCRRRAETSMPKWAKRLKRYRWSCP